MEALRILVQICASLISWLMILYVVIGWLLQFNVLNTHSPFVMSIWDSIVRLADMLCNPIRAILPDTGAIDLSPMVVLILTIVGERFLLDLLAGF